MYHTATWTLRDNYRYRQKQPASGARGVGGLNVQTLLSIILASLKNGSRGHYICTAKNSMSAILAIPNDMDPDNKTHKKTCQTRQDANAVPQDIPRRRGSPDDMTGRCFLPRAWEDPKNRTPNFGV